MVTDNVYLEFDGVEFAIGTDKFTVQRGTGDTVIAGTLTLPANLSPDVNDAVTRDYVDTEIAGIPANASKVSIDGSIAMTGPLTLLIGPKP